MSRLPLLFALALGLTACGARSQLGIGELADAGPSDACPPVFCSTSEHFDPQSCSCVRDGLERVGKSGGTPTQLSDKGGTAIALDDSYVYWISGGDVLRMKK